MQIFILRAHSPAKNWSTVLGYYATEELANAAEQEERQMLIDLQLFPVLFTVEPVTVITQ